MGVIIIIRARIINANESSSLSIQLKSEIKIISFTKYSWAKILMDM